MMTDQPFSPKWASSPGETIAETLMQRGISAPDFALKSGLSEDRVQDVISGNSPITRSIAELLHQHLGASVQFWINREEQYREDISKNRSSNLNEWIKRLPIRDMVHNGWIPEISDKSTDEIAEVFYKFFNIRTYSDWNQKLESLVSAAALKTSRSFDSVPESLAAWLMHGEIAGEKIACQKWNKDGFASALSEIRKLTLIKDPSVFLPRLTDICAGHGVAFVLARAPQGCRASGATRFLSYEKALLMLSGRYLSDDHFWFSFFHEAGHLIIHDQNLTFIEGSGSISDRHEKEADDFSARTLIPEKFHNVLNSLKNETKAILRAAKAIGVCPGIIVGQLQHAGKIPRNYHNRLKRRFEWN